MGIGTDRAGGASVGRSGAALLSILLLSALVSAEPERPCPGCRHGMARVEGQVAGAADYLCRFCEVAVHVRPDGREAVSFRIEGQRREFDFVDGARLAFPLPGLRTREEAIVPVDEAALAAAPGAGHPTRIPGHPVKLPGHPVGLPAAPVQLPDHPVRLPSHPVELPAAPLELPGQAIELPGHPVGLPAHAVTLPRHPVRLPGAPVRLSAHPTRLPGHPTRMTGFVVIAAAAVTPAPTPAAAEPRRTRFFGRPPMPSVLRGTR